MKLLFLIAEDSYFCTHRLNLGIAALKVGFEVAVATRCKKHAERIQAAGITVFNLKYFKRSGLNPFSQVRALKELYTIYKTYAPDVVHHVAMKPVLFGSLLAFICKTSKIINAFGGLGYLFTDSKPTSNPFASIKKNCLRFFVCRLLKWLHQQSNTTIILQNTDDINTFLAATNIDPKKIRLIQGSGVDLQCFPAQPVPDTQPIQIACVARMLWDKGIGELIEAAKIIQKQNLSIQILLYGIPDPENPASIQDKQLQAWHDAGLVIWKGHCEHVAKAYADCHIAVLPSYREGFPKSLLEAASVGRAIITTDAPGCREIVQNHQNGLLVPVKSARALAEAIIHLSLDRAQQIRMGLESRKIVETQFSDIIINQQVLALYHY